MCVFDFSTQLTDKCPTFVQLKKQLAREAKHVALLQLLIIPMCLVSFWFFTLLLVETFSFLVEVLIFIMIAIIIDSEDSMQYVSSKFTVFVVNFIFLSVCLCLFLRLCLSVCLPACLPVCLSVCLSVCLCLFVSLSPLPSLCL